jgi:hypothetical protein
MPLGSHKDRLEGLLGELTDQGVFPGTIDALRVLFEHVKAAEFERGLHTDLGEYAAKTARRIIVEAHEEIYGKGKRGLA